MGTDRFRLDGKRALVTGASKGIGLGIARGLAEAGADLVLVARSARDLEQAASSLEDTRREVVVYPFDMARVDALDGFFREIVAETGGVDILVNNAGTTRRAPAESLELADWNDVLTLNLSAVFALCRAFARDRIARDLPGKIVNIGSLLCEAARATTAAYAASKGGIRQLTKALAVDWAPKGIHVNAIGPGYIQTDLTRPMWEDPALDQWVLGRTPLGRWGTPGDLAQAAVFLASPASDFITGHILYVDGGFLASL